MAILKTVATNTAPPLAITCTRDGTAINLTGCTVTIIIKGGGVITQSGGSCTITDATNGVISYTPISTDFPTAGSYKCDLKVTYSDATIEILYEQLKIKARAKLA